MDKHDIQGEGRDTEAILRQWLCTENVLRSVIQHTTPAARNDINIVESQS